MSFSKEWWKAAAIRAVKTFAQAVLSVVTLGATLESIDWRYALSVGLVAFVYSFLTSLAGLPEVDQGGGTV